MNVAHLKPARSLSIHGAVEDNNLPGELYHAWAVHEGNVGRQPQDISTVAAEGDTLPDTTVLQAILIDGGVAISTSGQVAFGGRTGDGIDAAFTQKYYKVPRVETGSSLVSSILLSRHSVVIFALCSISIVLLLIYSIKIAAKRPNQAARPGPDSRQ